MAKDNNLSDFLKDIADALREKLGITEPINPQEFSTLIRSIEEYETVGEAVDRIINEIPSLVANGTLTDTKWAKVSSIKGNSMVWNQLVDITTTHEDYEGITTYSEDGEIVIHNLSREANYNSGSTRTAFSPNVVLVPNHKYYLWCNKNIAGIGAGWFTSAGPVKYISGNSFYTHSVDTQNILYLRITSAFDFATYCPIGSTLRFKMYLYDLTQMFGSGNEPTTIEEFESRKPLGVGNEYNPGEIISYQQWGEKVVWNQWVKPTWSTTNATIDKDGESIIVTIKSPSINYYGIYISNIDIIANHKILMDLDTTITSNAHIYGKVGTLWKSQSVITVAKEDPYLRIYKEGTFAEGDSFILRKCNIYDLTLMFGEGNEPTTIEEFERRRPRNVTDEYNEGTEVNGDIEIKSVGLNQINVEGREEVVANYDPQSARTIKFNEYWNGVAYNGYQFETHICSDINITSKNISAVTKQSNYGLAFPLEIIVGQTYKINYSKSSNIIHVLSKFNMLGKWISSDIHCTTFTAEKDVQYVYYIIPVNKGLISLQDLRITLADAPTDFKPYTSATTPLPNVSLIKDADGSQLFPYGLISAGSVYDEITETKVIKRVGHKILDGTEHWYIAPYGENTFRTDVLRDNAKTKDINWLSNRYENKHWGTGWSNVTDKMLYVYNADINFIGVVDLSYTTVNDFKNSLKINPIILYYELAEPIEVEIDKWKAEYKVEQGGTEHIVSANDTTNLKTNIIYGYKI